MISGSNIDHSESRGSVGTKTSKATGIFNLMPSNPQLRPVAESNDGPNSSRSGWTAHSSDTLVQREAKEENLARRNNGSRSIIARPCDGPTEQRGERERRRERKNR